MCYICCKSQSMLDAKDLRIGNLFIPIMDDGTPLEVRVIKASEFLALSENPERGNPIELTEEWLLKFGFEKTNRIDLGEMKPCYAIFSLAIMIRHNSFFIDWIGGNTEIKYVHTLQNIYYALTNTELTLKDEK